MVAVFFQSGGLPAGTVTDPPSSTKECIMNRSTILNLPKRILALVLVVVLLIPPAFASAGSTQLSTTQTLADGLVYRNTVSNHSSAGRMESFSFELQPDSDVYPIMVQAAGTVYGQATINRAIRTAEEMGYHVVGGINSDFYTPGSGVPNGISIENGVYKSSPEGYNAIAMVDGALQLVTSPQVNITVTNQRTGESVTFSHFNKWRSSYGGLYLFNEDFSTVSTHSAGSSGRMIRMVLSEEDHDASLTVNSTLSLTVTEVFETQDDVAIGEDNYILTAALESGYETLFSSYQPGDEVTLTTSCTDEALSETDWAGGCGDILISNGSITDSSNWTYRTGRAPRTAAGVKADGTMLFYTVDGRQSGYSGGLTEMDLAEELLQQGCVWAVNLDGGGSTTFGVRLPGSSGVTVANSPSDGSLRSCAAFLLLVTDPSTADGDPERLALQEDGLVVLAGTSVTLGNVTSLDGGVNTVSSRVSDAVFTSENGLGTLNGGVYTAGSTPGTDTIQIYSPSLDLYGTVQIHVVSALSGLTVTRSGSNAALSSLSLDFGESVSLTATGTYWSRTALRSGSGGVTWNVTGNIGTITQDGVFTASGNGTSGTITATAGGVTTSVAVTLNRAYVHTDVPSDHWAHTAVDYCYEHGIVSGISATEFGTNYPICRKDFVLMLYNALGKPAYSGSSGFTDVDASAYYATAVAWASANGLVSGVAPGRFAPDDLVTREQAATILHQAMPLLGLDSPEPDLSVLDQFADQAQISDFARPHMAALVSQGLLSGTGNGLSPKGDLTRAEMAALLYRLLTASSDPSTEDPEPDLDPSATLTLDVTESTLASTQSLQLNATLTGGTGRITWSSSDPTVATVSADGTVTNVYAGTGSPTVTITASCGTLTASAVIQCSPAERVGLVTASPSLNVRSGPGLDNSIVSSLKYGTQVIVLDSSVSGWYQVLFSSSGSAVTGWVSADYLSLL